MTDALYLREEFAAAWRGEDPFAAVASLRGDVVKDGAGRRTLRFEIGGRSYYVKQHRGVGWREILKNLVTLRAAVVDASNEYRALARLAERGIAAPVPAAFGVRGRNPAQRESFIVTDALTNRMSLAVLTQSWRDEPPRPAQKRALIRAVGQLTRSMHAAGVVHRDYYLVHLLIDPELWQRGAIDLALIDLHRAQVWAAIPDRWRLRDLGALMCWCVDLPLTRRDWLRFIRAYEDRPVREALRRNAALWSRVQRRGETLYREARRKGLVAP